MTSPSSEKTPVQMQDDPLSEFAGKLSFVCWWQPKTTKEGKKILDFEDTKLHVVK